MPLAALHRLARQLRRTIIPDEPIFTIGLLMLATPRGWRRSIVPVVWSLIGGTAALPFGVHADFALPVAGMALAIFVVQGELAPQTEEPAQ